MSISGVYLRVASRLQESLERRFRASGAWATVVRSAWAAFVILIVSGCFAFCVVETGWQKLWQRMQRSELLWRYVCGLVDDEL
jgi:hypothetical protein